MCITGYSTGLWDQVVIKGHSSTSVHVDSGVPQELFLVLSCFITSSTRLFADDCVLYCVVHSEQDQQDLNHIIQWTKQWQMSLNIDKCVIIILRSTSPPEFQYYINNETLTCTSQHLYLGVLFHSPMSFSPP